MVWWWRCWRFLDSMCAFVASCTRHIASRQIWLSYKHQVKWDENWIWLVCVYKHISTFRCGTFVWLMCVCSCTSASHFEWGNEERERKSQFKQKTHFQLIAFQAQRISISKSIGCDWKITFITVWNPTEWIKAKFSWNFVELIDWKHRQNCPTDLIHEQWTMSTRATFSWKTQWIYGTVFLCFIKKHNLVFIIHIHGNAAHFTRSKTIKCTYASTRKWLTIHSHGVCYGAIMNMKSQRNDKHAPTPPKEPGEKNGEREGKTNSFNNAMQ